MATIEGIEIPEGFEDTSYGNDVCPSIEGFNIKVFIDYADVALREYPEHPRFTFYVMDKYGQAFPFDNYGQSDAWSDVLAYIAAHKHDSDGDICPRCDEYPQGCVCQCANCKQHAQSCACGNLQRQAFDKVNP